jgi:ribosomal protein S18 acetylase RimI-like enzyme
VQEFQAHLNQFFDRNKPPQAMGTWYVAKLRADVMAHSGAFLVAEADGGAVIGYATLLTHCTSADVEDEVLYTYALIPDLAVSADWRGRGVGRMLLAECERITRAANVNYLRLDVLAGNARARELYRREGFSDQLITMEKKL